MKTITLPEDVANQLESIRSEGKYNMFEFYNVQSYAFSKDYYALVHWMEEHKADYPLLIFNGFNVQTDEGIIFWKKYFKVS